MDELTPSVLRNSPYFMYPAFYFWFKGKNLKSHMDFKSYAHRLTEREFADIYKKIEIRGNDRETDLNSSSVRYMLESLDKGAQSMLDVGCGRGYWLNKVANETTLDLTGCDLYDNVKLQKGNYIKASVESLPFKDKQYDIVTCHHTIEHVRDLAKAISELKRVTKNQLIIVTPRQRYYYYTLDLHLNFFPTETSLISAVNLTEFTCKKIWGDWVYITQDLHD